jgi:hypothetical protein
MIFEIANSILLLFSLMLNIKILNIANNLQKNNIKNPRASLADIAENMMSCDSCEACEACEARDIRDSCDIRDIRKENDMSPQNIYTDGMDGTDNENDNINLLENNRLCEKREWTEIQIAK